MICKVCERHYPRKDKNNLVCSTCRNNYQRYKSKRKALKILGDKCFKCDENDLEVLTFHHTDPETKEIELASSWANVNWEILEKEINKCILLCANCHIKKHKKDLSKLIDFYEGSNNF